MKQYLHQGLEGLLHLFFPHLCLICQTSISGPRVFCSLCLGQLPPSHFLQFRENAFTDRFFGRIPLTGAYSSFFLHAGGTLETLLYQLKYQDRPQIGDLLGAHLGRSMVRLPDWVPPEFIMPVPLHPKKKRLRGYNQSTRIGAGLQEVLQIPLHDHALIRPTYTQSQTRKGKMERLANVEKAFMLRDNAQHYQGAHILLVDDVMTTGATLEACANQLLEIPGVQISLATLAIASI